ncbi:MAG: WhiB family transcriptional regulator [Nitriliruptorales bacterium]|nr:WhiB family transcriptional regulator [Nitriliruptorales bacterium]
MQMDWVEDARCRGIDAERFFVRGAVKARKAIRVCERCEVRDACLEYALEHDVDFGVWGGLTERQRRAERRSRVGAVG